MIKLYLLPIFFLITTSCGFIEGKREYVREFLCEAPASVRDAYTAERQLSGVTYDLTIYCKD